PGFGSQMRWLPDYGVGIIAFGNRTYAGWGAPIDAALEVFARAGALEPRMAKASPALHAAREQVTRLVMKWDAALAQSLAADNLFLDRSADRRSAEIAAHLERVGSCRAPAGFAYVENALRGQWILECERGNLLVSITLAPTLPTTVQYLEVTRAPAGGAAALRPRTCS
ncbi:MAG: hypothetical protein P3A28_10000, partial [Gemmatimonadota bacterium]|nr:hypothetical protein [Gemmatimonadota bacterium]